MRATIKNYCINLLIIIIFPVFSLLYKYIFCSLINNSSNSSYKLFKNIQNISILKEMRVGIISNENYEYINKFENFLKENNIKIQYLNNSSEIKDSKSNFDFIFKFKNNEKKIMNKEDEIEIEFEYSLDFIDKIIPDFRTINKPKKLQLLITNYLSTISNITNIPSIIVETLQLNNKEYKYKALIIIFFDIFIYYYIFLIVDSKIIIEKKEHIFDYLSSQGITFNHNYLSWFLIFLSQILPSFLLSFINLEFFEDNKLTISINQLSFNIDIIFIYSLILLFIIKYENSEIIHLLIITLIIVLQFFLLFYFYFNGRICFKYLPFVFSIINFFQSTNEKNILESLLYFIISLVLYFLILFILQKSFKSKKKDKSFDLSSFETNDQIDNYENHEQLTEMEISIKNENNYLNVKNITKQFDDLKAINNFSCELFPGEIFCLLGHNGAGKTTLIKIISGIEKIDEGDIILNGISILNDKNYFIKNIGVCHQENILFGELTVDDMIYYSLKLKGKTKNKDEIDSYIKDIGLEEKRKDLCKNLSTGQKRKLCIILSLIGNNKIILLDEPTSGLDAIGRRELWKFLQRNKKDKIILLTTHSLEEAEFLGDRIGIIKEGEYICSGTSSYLKNKYPHGYNINLLISSRFNYENRQQMLNDLKVIDSTSFIKISSNSLLTINFNNLNGNVINSIFKYIEDSKSLYNINKYTVSTTSLEDVFINLNVKNFSNQLLKIPWTHSS